MTGPTDIAALIASLPEDARPAFMSKAQEMGLPLPKDEDWRFTPIARALSQCKLARATPEPVLECDPILGPLDIGGAQQICYRDGLPSSGMSMSQDELSIETRGVAASSPDEMEGIFDVFDVLNTSLATELAITVAPGAQLSVPIHLVHVSSNANLARYSRISITVGKGASLSLIESHVTEGQGLTSRSLGGQNLERENTADGGHCNTEVMIRLEEDARMDHYRWFDQPERGVHVNGLFLSLGTKADYEGFSLTKSESSLTRHNLGAHLGDSSICRLDGAWLLDGTAHCDTRSFIHHAMPAAASRQTQKGVIGGSAHGVFQGKILVAEDAQKTDGYQLSRTMVLNNTARSSSKPELEIYADDVKCSHGSTTGAIVPEELLYLCSRGIDEQTARQMLISAFVADVFEAVEHETHREAFLSKIRDWGQSRVIQKRS